MTRYISSFLLLLLPIFMIGCSSESLASQPETSERGPVWAYGAEVNGEPWFDVHDGVAHYQGEVQYYPRLPLEDQSGAVVVEKRVRDAHNVLVAATTEANRAFTPSGYVTSYCQELDKYEGSIVTSYHVQWNEIIIRFKDWGIDYHQGIPLTFPATQWQGRDPGDALEEQVERFWTRYDEGNWICWGSDYFMIVPREWQQRSADAIDQVNQLIDSGLRGDALQAAVDQIDVKDTPLKEPGFLRDLLKRGN